MLPILISLILIFTTPIHSQDIISKSEKLFYEAEFDKAIELLENYCKLNTSNLNQKLRVKSQITKIKLFKNSIYELPQPDYKTFLDYEKNINSIDDQKIKADYLKTLGMIKFYKDDFVGAENYYQKALELYKKTGSTKNIGFTINDIALCKFNRMPYPGAPDFDIEKEKLLLPEFNEALDIINKGDYKYEKSFVLRHIAFIYWDMGELNKALNLFEESLSLREKIEFKPYLPPSYFTIAEIKNEMNETDAAKSFYCKSYEMADKIGFVRYRINPRIKLAEIYLSEDNKEKALTILSETLKISQEINYNAGIQKVEKFINSIKK